MSFVLMWLFVGERNKRMSFLFTILGVSKTCGIISAFMTFPSFMEVVCFKYIIAFKIRLKRASLVIF